MKINKELIEKYHRKDCTNDEAEAVEEWLFSPDSDEALQLPMAESKFAHKQEMWENIQQTDFEEKISIVTKPRSLSMAFWSGALAASVALVLMTFIFYKVNYKVNSLDAEMLSLNNTSAINVKNITSSDYDIALGPKTSARINRVNGIVDLSGNIILKPTKDIELTFGHGFEKIIFKTGESYIVLNDMESKGSIIIVNERNLMDLPPVMQKQIINQFKI